MCFTGRQSEIRRSGNAHGGPFKRALFSKRNAKRFVSHESLSKFSTNVRKKRVHSRQMLFEYFEIKSNTFERRVFNENEINA